MKHYVNYGFRILLRLAGIFPIVGVTTYLLKLAESRLEIQLIALLYLLPVLACTVLWGLTSGIIAGIASFLAFNYYFIQPYFTLDVRQTQDLISLIVFLIVAVVVSQLIGRARQAVRLAEKREQETTSLYKVTAELAGMNDAREIIGVLAQKLMEIFELEQVEISTLAPPAQEKALCRLPQQALEKPADLVVSLSTARHEEGEIRLWFDQNRLSIEDARLLSALCNQGALAIERVRLFTSENLARILEESDKVKTSLLNSVSHELRSPLAVIKASASSLRNGTVQWNTPASVELVATIDEETDALNLLVGNLLDMSRIEAGALKPMKRWNSIIEIIKGVETKMQAQLVEHPLKLEIYKAFPLIPTDYVMMGQVFTNLFSNSIKYAPEKTSIVVCASVAGEQAVIQVINQSPPVAVEHLDRMFDKFVRITVDDKITGTGLGLSICKGIIEAHEGRIWAENAPGGFTFTISLPLTLDGAYPRMPEELNNG